MADKGTSEILSPAQVDRAAIEKYNKLLKESLDRDARLFRHDEWRGNKLPPFSIEPFPHERQRLADGGMTPAQRALRKQWVLDQELAPNEPRNIPELTPRNPFRRVYSAPWNGFFRMVTPFLTKEMSGSSRWYVPRACFSIAVAYGIYYHMKYHENDWTTKNGWYTWVSKGRILPGDEGYPEGPAKPDDEWFDRGFKQRNVLLDLRTSSVSD